MGQPQRPSNLWHADGSLRDVYCSPCTSEHWEAFLCFANRYEPVYSFEGEVGRIPAIDSIFTNREGSHLLALRVGSAQVNCHFFVLEELELDIDPREVREDAQHDRLMEFFFELAKAIGLPVRLTPENSPDQPFFTVDPGASVPRHGGKLCVQADCRPISTYLPTAAARQRLNMALGAGLQCCGKPEFAVKIGLLFQISTFGVLRSPHLCGQGNLSATSRFAR